MQRDLATAGHVVTWHPFDGGHETPAEVVVALNQFIRELHLNSSRDRLTLHRGPLVQRLGKRGLTDR
jgi:hypothetical protein